MEAMSLGLVRRRRQPLGRNSVARLAPEIRLGRMARKIRIESAGAIYHVMNRGDRREAIFKDDSDRELFLTPLGEACQKTGWVACRAAG